MNIFEAIGNGIIKLITEVKNFVISLNVPAFIDQVKKKSIDMALERTEKLPDENFGKEEAGNDWWLKLVEKSEARPRNLPKKRKPVQRKRRKRSSKPGSKK